MRSRLWIAAAAFAFAANSHAARLDFVTLGDTAYRLPADLPIYDALIGKINAAKPAFSIHVGDICGANACRQAQYEEVLAKFQQFRAPVVYTPGDNEWVDCRDPEVIAAYVRFVRQQATPEDLALLGPLRSFDAAFTRAGYDDVVARLGLKAMFPAAARAVSA